MLQNKFYTPAIISLASATSCDICGTELEVGANVREYSNNKTSGVDCHDKPTQHRNRRPQSFRRRKGRMS